MDRRRAGGTEKTFPVGRRGIINVIFFTLIGNANILFVGKAQAKNIIWCGFLLSSW